MPSPWLPTAGGSSDLPPAAAALNRQALAAVRNGDAATALALWQQAVALAPQQSALRNNLALAHKQLQHFGEAEHLLRALVADQPLDGEAWSNLGEVCKAQGQLDEALQACRRALACPGSRRAVHDNLLLLLHYLPQSDRAGVAAAHRHYGERFPPQPLLPHGNTADPERPLRIGYLSPDIRRHAAARFLEPLLRGRDRSRFRVVLYGEVERRDATSERLIGLADGWCATTGLSSRELAARIRGDGIDLLVDLAGHTAGNRLDVLPLRPAPLQLTTLGYPDSTGLAGLDGRISDAVLDPPGEEGFSSEPLLRLPGSFACFQPPAIAPAVADPPCLTGRPLRLLSPHQLFKLNEPLLRLWARVLAQLPGAELVLLRSSTVAANRAAVTLRLQRCGIDPARVRLEPHHQQERDYLRTIAGCDLMLDAWPHSGHTTSCEALWMGLPVITLRGDLPCGRLSASVLSAIGRATWIAESADAYVATAVAVASDPDGLREARRSLRGRLATTVADAGAFMAGLEALYRQLWCGWCSANGGSEQQAGGDHEGPATGQAIGQTRTPALPHLLPTVAAPMDSASADAGNGALAAPATPAQDEPTTAERPHVAVRYEHSLSLPALLERLNLSVLLSTYQAGRVVSLGCHQGQLQVGFSRFDQAMGLARTPTGLVVGSRDAVWSLPASREIAPRIKPEGQHDIAFLARSCHHSGPLMGHDLAWCGDRLWLVNTLFNGLVTIEGSWSFVPQWQPAFISGWAAGDRCHLNGLAISDDGRVPAYVTVLGECDSENGWRENKAMGGCLIHVPSGEVVLRGLAMPHSPRLYNGQLYLLDSGQGALERFDPLTGTRSTVARLPGFTRGLDCFAGHAFVGLSQIRETAVFGGLPLQEAGQQLRCGLAVVDLSSGELAGLFWFHSGVEEVFAVAVLPGYRNPVVIGPDTSTDDSQTIWMVPRQPGRSDSPVR
ncbi:MAG: TIGR03032 family protein [Cyanobium sp.]|nr:TIGR03032 family protein [Cyanobium sp.]